MVVLLDANIILNYLTNRNDPYTQDCVEIMNTCVAGKITPYIAFHSLSIIWYVLRKTHSEDMRRKVLRNVCSIVNVASASREQILDAIDREDFRDFEDCLQDKCAQMAEADYIVTCNVKDFKNAEIPVLPPNQLLEIVKEL